MNVTQRLLLVNTSATQCAMVLRLICCIPIYLVLFRAAMDHRCYSNAVVGHPLVVSPMMMDCKICFLERIRQLSLWSRAPICEGDKNALETWNTGLLSPHTLLILIIKSPTRCSRLYSTLPLVCLVVRKFDDHRLRCEEPLTCVDYRFDPGSTAALAHAVNIPFRFCHHT